MSIRIMVFGEIAQIKDGDWESVDNYLQDVLSEINIDSIIGYTPWPDYTLAEMACKALGGEIIEATGPPEYVEGRVY